jgi:hypothetical protein
VPDVRGEEDAGYVGFVGDEAGYGDYGRGVVALDHAPYVDVSLCARQSMWLERGRGDVQRYSPRKQAIHPTQP